MSATSLLFTSAAVGGSIVEITTAIELQNSSPIKIAEMSAAKKILEAKHTILQMAYGAATG